MLKTSFQKRNPKKIVYIDYISFSDDCFLTNLSNSIENAQCYEAFEAKTVEVFNHYAFLIERSYYKNNRSCAGVYN